MTLCALTPGITRPQAPLLLMKSIVSRVGCMPLLGRPAPYLPVFFNASLTSTQ